jgi:hypothetical protein
MGGQATLVPVAYNRGTAFEPAGRRPLADMLQVERW